MFAMEPFKWLKKSAQNIVNAIHSYITEGLSQLEYSPNCDKMHAVVSVTEIATNSHNDDVGQVLRLIASNEIINCQQGVIYQQVNGPQNAEIGKSNLHKMKRIDQVPSTSEEGVLPGISNNPAIAPSKFINLSKRKDISQTKITRSESYICHRSTANRFINIKCRDHIKRLLQEKDNFQFVQGPQKYNQSFNCKVNNSENAGKGDDLFDCIAMPINKAFN